MDTSNQLYALHEIRGVNSYQGSKWVDTEECRGWCGVMSEGVNKSLRMEGRDRNEHLLTLKGFVALFWSLLLLHVAN